MIRNKMTALNRRSFHLVCNTGPFAVDVLIDFTSLEIFRAEMYGPFYVLTAQLHTVAIIRRF